MIIEVKQTTGRTMIAIDHITLWEEAIENNLTVYPQGVNAFIHLVASDRSPIAVIETVDEISAKYIEACATSKLLRSNEICQTSRQKPSILGRPEKPEP